MSLGVQRHQGTTVRLTTVDYVHCRRKQQTPSFLHSCFYSQRHFVCQQHYFNYFYTLAYSHMHNSRCLAFSQLPFLCSFLYRAILTSFLLSSPPLTAKEHSSLIQLSTFPGLLPLALLDHAPAPSCQNDFNKKKNTRF